MFTDFKYFYQEIEWYISNEVTHHNLNVWLKFDYCDLSLIAIHISGCCQFSDIRISQGSVATYLRCGGIFKHEWFLLKFLPLSLLEKKNENRLIFEEVIGKSLASSFLTRGAVFGNVFLVFCVFTRNTAILCSLFSLVVEIENRVYLTSACLYDSNL